MSRASSCIRAIIALATVAVIASGCAVANNATSAQASSRGEQPYKTMYGMNSEGPTTDLYTELFGSSQSQPAPATAVASAQPVQPVAAPPITPAQQNSAPNYQAPAQAATGAYANRPSQPQTAAASRTPQPAPSPAPVQVAQQPAPPPPPQEPDVPTAYGIPANGPTTDLYTAIFGPRRSNSQ